MSARYEISEGELDVLAITGPEGTRYIDGEEIEARVIRQQSADIAELRAKLAAAEFWRDVYPDGATADQIANELADYKMILENVSLVYCHVTDGRISKGNTLAGEVIREADAIMDSAIGEAVHEERQLTMQAEAERDQLRAELAAAVAERDSIAIERDHARLTLREIAQILIEQIGSVGPENAVNAALRACEVIESMASRLSAIYSAPVVAWLSTDCIGERYLCFSAPDGSDPVVELIARPSKEST